MRKTMTSPSILMSMMRSDTSLHSDCPHISYCSKSKFNLFESNGDGLPFLMMTGSLFCVFLLLFHSFHLLLNLFYAQDICAGRYSSVHISSGVLYNSYRFTNVIS
jgi:hypothetical protein